MDSRTKRFIAVVAALAVAIVLIVWLSNRADAADGGPGSSPDNPIVVDSLNQIPAEAALSAVVNDNCSTTTTGVLTVPGNEDTSHQEFRYMRDVPGVDEVSHQEFKYKQVVKDYTTEYHFRKFTHTKYLVNGVWGDYGPWTAWEPMTHESWESSNAPIGSPEFHGSGPDWYREWQAQADGQTRQVESGSHEEFTDWTTDVLGAPWVKVDERKVVDSAAVPGYTEYYVLGGNPSQNEADASWILAEQAPAGWTQFDERTVNNEDGSDPVTTYYQYNDGERCDKPQPPKHHGHPPVRQPDVPVLIEAGL